MAIIYAFFPAIIVALHMIVFEIAILIGLLTPRGEKAVKWTWLSLWTIWVPLMAFGILLDLATFLFVGFST